INWARKEARIPRTKSGKPLTVPLNERAMAILEELKGEHELYVFTYEGQPMRSFSKPSWRKALKRAGIEDFRWHDLRHTWATWHILDGTSIYELQRLGGWETLDMVLR